MFRSISLSLLAATAFCAFSTLPAFDADAFEDTQTTDEGKLSFSLSAAYFDMDVANGLGSSINDFFFLFVRQAENGAEIDAVGINGSVDFWSPVELPNLGTTYVFGGLTGAWVDDDDNGMSTLQGADFLDVLPIDGTPALDFLSGPGTDFFTSADAEFWRIGAYAGLGNDIAGGEGKIGFGIYGAVSRLDLNSSIQDQSGTNFMRLNEEVDTYSVGPMISGERKVSLPNGMTAFVGGKAAILYADGDLDAWQSASFLPNPISVGDSESDIAFLGQLNAGIELFSNGQTTVSLTGAVEWRNDVYEIVNPRAGPGDDTGSASFTPGPARIEQTDQFSASLGVKATVRF